jgi:hypothetical protein
MDGSNNRPSIQGIRKEAVCMAPPLDPLVPKLASRPHIQDYKAHSIHLGTGVKCFLCPKYLRVHRRTAANRLVGQESRPK